MNMGCMTPVEVRDLYVFSVSVFVYLVFFFSRNTRAENAGKLPSLVGGGEA